MRLSRVFACLVTLSCLVFGTLQTHAAGALATGNCGAYGYAFDDPSAKSAEKRALRACRGKNCRVVATVRRGCAAFAVDGSNFCGAHGWATADTLGRAQNAATKTCYKFGGRNCVIRAWACDAKG
jgi:hypothetical protein